MGVLSFITTYIIAVILYVADVVSFFILKKLNHGKSKPLPPIKNPLISLRATELVDKIKRREIKCLDVIEAYISRIDETHSVINAVIDKRYDEARDEAKLIDNILDSDDSDKKQSLLSLPLLGIPFSAKDSVCVKGLINSYGLHSRRNTVATEDAELIECLKKSGAICLCITNVPELCMWWETYNNIYGHTNNPYDTTRIVGGSSGGEGALIAAGGSIIGVGSDIGGSIRMPALFNGIFGHKPSYAIVSVKGLKPDSVDLSEKCLAAGPMCRYASDLPVMFKAMAGDNIKQLSLDKKVDLKSLKFYFMEDDGGSTYTSSVAPELKQAMKKVINHFENKFNVKVHQIYVSKMKYAYEMWETILGNSEGPSFASDMGNNEKEVSAFGELLKWFVGRSDFTLPIILQGIMWLFANKKGSKESEQIIAMSEVLQKQLKEILGDDSVFFYPSHPYPALYHYQTLAMPYNLAYTAVFNFLQMPVTQCPLGLNSEGLPLGIQVASAPYNDHLTLAVALEIEETFGGWVNPSPSVE